jgi:hypothetical protein
VFWHGSVRAVLAPAGTVHRLPTTIVYKGSVHPAYNLSFSVRIVFFSHNKLVNSVFQPTYKHSRTGKVERAGEAAFAGSSGSALQVVTGPELEPEQARPLI